VTIRVNAVWEPLGTGVLGSDGAKSTLPGSHQLPAVVRAIGGEALARVSHRVSIAGGHIGDRFSPTKKIRVRFSALEIHACIASISQAHLEI